MSKKKKLPDADEVRQKSIIDYLMRRGYTPIRQGKEVKFFSPFRQEKVPSFFVNPEKNLWYDFGTGEGGDIISLVKKIEGVDFPGAIAYLENDCINPVTIKKEDSPTPYPKAREAELFYRAISRTSNDVFVARFFKQKGLNIHPSIGAVEYKSLSGQRFIAIPCPSKDRVFGLECRGVNDDGTDSYHRDGRKIRKTTGHKIPWVFKRQGKECLVTESIIDALAGEIIFGFNGTLVALNGVGNTKFLPKICEKNTFEVVYLALDNDPAGQEAQRRAITILKDTVKVEIITDHQEKGVKDLYELYKLLELRLGGENKETIKEVAL